MQLPGRLERTTLGDVLATLLRERVTGVLEIRDRQGGTHRVHVERGVVRDVETNTGATRLGDSLRALGADQAVQRELDRASFDVERDGPLGMHLLRAGLISHAQLRAALERQSRARLSYLFCLREGELRFRVATRDHATRDQRVRATLPAEEVLAGRPRARDKARVHDPSRPHRSAEERRREDERASALRTLQLQPNADRAAVNAAFRKLAAEVHPDRSHPAACDERAARMREFARLSAAYHVLVA
jgi:hypothetical protein